MKTLQKTEVRHVKIEKDDEGRRLDNYLISQLPKIPKTHIYRLLRKGEVRINRGRVKQSYRLKVGDLLRIPPIYLDSRENTKKQLPTPSAQLLKKLKQSILFENEDFLIIDKPHGLAVHGGTGISATLINALNRLYAKDASLTLVHRLDRETSGCLIIAKNRRALNAFHQLLRENKIKKTYIALVKGHWPKQRKMIDASLSKNRLRSGERMVEIDPQGKASLTVFEPIQYFPSATLVKIILHSGRMHQIRVHAAHAGHPIAGDSKYGDRNFNQQMKNLGLKRLFLHSSELSFIDPIHSKRVHVLAPLSESLETFCSNLS